MTIVLTNAGMEVAVDVPLGSPAGFVRNLVDDLEEIGAPSSYTLAINGEAANDDTALSPGARVSFRPITASKG